MQGGRWSAHCRTRRGRSPRSVRQRWERLARSRKNLSWPRRRWGGARWNHRTAIRGSVRAPRLPGCQRRTQRKRGPHRRGRFGTLERCRNRRPGGLWRGRRRRTFRNRCRLLFHRNRRLPRRFLPRRRLVTRCVFFRAHSRHAPAEAQHHIVVERAGVRLLVCDPKFRQQIQNDVGLYLEFPCQLVDANFTHT